MRQQITEEMGLQKEWYKEARTIKLDTLKPFIDRLMNEYEHDYGTICHALAAGSIATFCAMNSDEYQGGITGFQAGAIMWQIVRHLMYENNKCGLRLLDFDNFLYPQYEESFDKTISKETWEVIQKEASRQLEKATEKVHPAVIEHWNWIKEGVVPFGYKVKSEEQENEKL